MTVEGTNKVGESVVKMTHNDALIVCDVNSDIERKDQPKTTPIKTGIEAKRNKLERIMPELYNLENCNESEKPVKIDLDLDLYQMENF